MITLLVFGNIYAFYWVAKNLPYLLRGREKIILGMDFDKLILGNNGPIRNGSSAFCDWAPHVYSMLSFFSHFK